jgi:hypothetical protein
MMLNNEFEGMWKGAVVFKFKILSWYLLDGLWKTTKYIRKFGIAAKI